MNKQTCHLRLLLEFMLSRTKCLRRIQELVLSGNHQKAFSVLHNFKDNDARYITLFKLEMGRFASMDEIGPDDEETTNINRIQDQISMAMEEECKSLQAVKMVSRGRFMLITSTHISLSREIQQVRNFYKMALRMDNLFKPSIQEDDVNIAL